MANVNITVLYDPTKTSNRWSLTASGATVTNGNVVHLKTKGDTSIKWDIALGPDLVDGRIAFSTDPANPGIVFSGTPPWPGTTPTGNANNWNATVNNTQGGLSFYFLVNAVFTQNGTAQPIRWDPEVEEDPPVVAA